MKNLLNAALLAFSVLFFTSCEGNTEFVLHIKNNSSETITIVPEVEWSYMNFEDSIQLVVGETKQIAQWNQRGGNEQSIDITGNISTIKGFQLNSKVLDSTVCKSTDRWVEVIERRTKIPSNVWHYYVLTLEDVDFQ